MPLRFGKLGRRMGPEGATSLLLFALFVAVYSCSVDLSSKNLLWHNFVFDADLDRVVADATGRQNEVVFGRHPLFFLVFAAPASLFSAVGLGPAAALRMFVAVASALGVVAARTVFHRILEDRILAVAFAVLYGCSSAVWLLSSVPETFALNACAVAVCFLATSAPGSDGRNRWARLAAFALFSAAAIGLTVSNAVYVALSCVARVRREATTARRRLGLVLTCAALVALSFVGLSLLQQALFAGHVPHSTGVVNPLGAASEDAFLDLRRGSSWRDTTALLRAFLLDNLVAPGAVIEIVDTKMGPSQMLQFGDRARPGYWLGALLLVSVVLVATRRGTVNRVLRLPEAQLAFAYLGFNLVLHHFYRANGQPFIFTIHTALPVLVLVTALCAGSKVSFLRPLVAVTAAAVVANSAFFVASVREALALPCETRVGAVCTAWAGSPAPRWTRGLDAYLGSGWHAAELGRASLEQGHTEEAIQLYRAAVARDRTLLWAERDLGLALLQLGRRSEATVHLESVLARDPTDTLARQALRSLRP